ncbi:hypothetical protein T492DRAFT_858631 [Pavlovales sp. CCMP2436]|nr:hypothetical protein T492DRAFT_858631 [Pavlovales sp. CCMP2436]
MVQQGYVEEKKSGRAICIKRAINFLQHDVFEDAPVVGSHQPGAPYKQEVYAAMLLFGLAGVGIAAVYSDSHKPKLPVRYSGNGQICAR